MITTAPATTFAERLAAVEARIARAAERSGRDRAAITLIAVSKGQPAAAIETAFAHGLRHFGENRVQEGLAKRAELPAAVLAGARFHLVGHLQSNKARDALAGFAILHGVDSERVLDALSARAAAPVHLFLEVNVAREPSKHGVLPEQLPGLLARARSLPHLVVEGLMTVAPLVADAEQARPVFRELHRLARRHGLRSLSMGMTNDFEAAIEEGATHIRIGRALFGARP